MKSNLDYYPHYKEAHRHPKFKALRAIYGGGAEGWAAEGRFWALNNIIADSELCQLDLNKKRNRAVVAEEIGLSLEELNQFIEILVSEDVELLFEIDTGIFSNEKIQTVLNSAQKQREKARTRKLLQSSPENMESSPDPNNRRKEKKGKETKGEESRGNSFPPAPEDVDNFFLRHKQTKAEASKFLNYYNARDWTINGTKIIDWEHAAKGWIDRIPSFNNKNNGKKTSIPPDFCTYNDLLRLLNEGNKDVWELYEKDPDDPARERYRKKSYDDLPI